MRFSSSFLTFVSYPLHAKCAIILINSKQIKLFNSHSVPNLLYHPKWYTVNNHSFPNPESVDLYITSEIYAPCLEKTRGYVFLTDNSFNNQRNFSSCMEIECILPSPEKPSISHNLQPLQSTIYVHSYPFLTDHFNVTRSTPTCPFRAYLSLLSFSVAWVCRPPPFFILSCCFKQATLNLTLTFSTGLTAPLTCYTNQLKVWKCCSCATHFIHKIWTRNLKLR
jgi:hypothetical protein